MKINRLNPLFLLLAGLINGNAICQDDHDHDHPDVDIHLFENGETWSNCSFVLHESLTQSEFRRFAKEGGTIIYFQPLSGASSLGRFKFDIGLSMTSTPIDQTSGAWNNTFAHPINEAGESPHWLGDNVRIPNLRFRMGLTDNIEVGTYITKDFNGNYGFFGVDAKYSKVMESKNNANVAARASYAQLFGPKDLKFSTAAIDVLVSKNWSVFEPYFGVSIALNHAEETTDRVDLEKETVIVPRLLLGTKVKYKWFSSSVEYDISALSTLSLKMGVTF